MTETLNFGDTFVLLISFSMCSLSLMTFIKYHLNTFYDVEVFGILI